MISGAVLHLGSAYIYYSVILLPTDYPGNIRLENAEAGSLG